MAEDERHAQEGDQVEDEVEEGQAGLGEVEDEDVGDDLDDYEGLSLEDVTGWVRDRWIPLAAIVAAFTLLFAGWGLTRPATYGARAVVRLDTTSFSYYPTLFEAEAFIDSPGFQQGVFRDAGEDEPPPGTTLSKARFRAAEDKLELVASSTDASVAAELAAAAADRFVRDAGAPYLPAAPAYAAVLKEAQTELAAVRKQLGDEDGGGRSGEATADGLMHTAGELEREIRLLRLEHTRAQLEDSAVRARQARVLSPAGDARATISRRQQVARGAALGFLLGIVVAIAVLAGPEVARRLRIE